MKTLNDYFLDSERITNGENIYQISVPDFYHLGITNLTDRKISDFIVLRRLEFFNIVCNPYGQMNGTSGVDRFRKVIGKVVHKFNSSVFNKYFKIKSFSGDDLAVCIADNHQLHFRSFSNSYQFSAPNDAKGIKLAEKIIAGVIFPKSEDYRPLSLHYLLKKNANRETIVKNLKYINFSDGSIEEIVGLLSNKKLKVYELLGEYTCDIKTLEEIIHYLKRQATSESTYDLKKSVKGILAQKNISKEHLASLGKNKEIRKILIEIKNKNSIKRSNYNETVQKFLEEIS